MSTLFSVDLYVDDRYAVVAARGDVHLRSVGPLRLALAHVTDGRPEVCIIDAAGLAFIDETAEQLLLETQRALAAQGGRLVLVNLPLDAAQALSSRAVAALAPIHFLDGEPLQPWRTGDRVPGASLLSMFGLAAPAVGPETRVTAPDDASDLDANASSGVFARLRHFAGH